MRFSKLVTAVVLSAFATSSFAGLSSMDRKFMMTVAQAGIFEVSANKLAQQMGDHPEVKQHAMHMVMDHSKSNAELMNMAKRKGVRLPKSMASKHANMMSKLKGLEGGSFDKYHVQNMLKSHKDAIALFKKQAEHGSDKQLKEWARGKIMKLEEHRDMWMRAAAELGIKG